MNKQQKEVTKAQLQAEQEELNALEEIYRAAAADIKNKIQISDGEINFLLAHYDELDDEMKSILRSQIYQRKFQQSLERQIDQHIGALDSDVYTSVDGYLKQCYETGYTGAMYDLKFQGIPLAMPIDEKKVVRALRHNTKLSVTLYKKLGIDVKTMKKRIAVNISRGIATSSSWSKIAQNIDAEVKIGYNKTMRIARTEGHRIQCESAFDAQHDAKKAGADIVKQWDSALDKRTRPHHRLLDGQLRELDEPFEVEGRRAMYPSGFGIAGEDINCRCALLQRARWALDDEELQVLKDRAAYYGLDKAKDFDDYKKKYLKVEEN